MYEWLLHDIWIFIKQWVWIPLLIMYISIIITILVENRQPNKTISWILVIVMIPIIGVFFYYIFGQKFQKVKLFQEKNKKHSTYLDQRWTERLPEIKVTLQEIHQNIGSLSKVFYFLVNQKLSIPTFRNRATLLINGEQKFPKLLEAISNAKHHIHLEYYIFEPDSLGMEIIELLGKKVQEGVQVRLIIDAFGSPSLVRKRKKLEALGIELTIFLPVGIASLANSNYRNHRKVAIIDAEIAFVGGINISQKYINSPQKQLYWRDTSICLEGPSINSLQLNFWLDWAFSEGKPFEISKDYLWNKEAYPLIHENAAIGLCYSDPGSKSPYNMEALLIAIAEAQRKITLCTPYFIPSEELSTALQLAAATGIEVELMLPEKGDSYIVQHASLSFLKPLLERGVKVFLYKMGFIHAKTVCVDGKLAFVGTVNLDTRSFYINFEVMATIHDHTICDQLEAQFEADKLVSEKIDINIWKQRPRWKRGIDSICRLFAPLL